MVDHQGHCRRRNRQQDTTRILSLLIALLGILLLNACTTGGGRRGHSRDSVSDTAARAAHKENPGRGTGHTRTKTDNDDDYAEEEDASSSFLVDLLISLFTKDGDDDSAGQDQPQDSEQATAGSWTRSSRSLELDIKDDSVEEPRRAGPPSGDSPGHSRDNLIVWLSEAYPAGYTIESESSLSVMYSAYFNRHRRGHLGLYYSEIRKGSRDLVQDGIGEIWEYGADIGAREYLTPSYTHMSLYLLIGVRAGAMRWTYAWTDPLPGEDRVLSDGVFVVTPYLGIGTSLIQLKSFHLGVSLSGGLRNTFNETFKNFRNDLFRNMRELRLNIETSFFF